MNAESFNKRFFLPALDTLEAVDKYPQPKYFGKQVVFKLKDNFRDWCNEQLEEDSFGPR